MSQSNSITCSRMKAKFRGYNPKRLFLASSTCMQVHFSLTSTDFEYTTNLYIYLFTISLGLSLRIPFTVFLSTTFFSVCASGPPSWWWVLQDRVLQNVCWHFVTLVCATLPVFFLPSLVSMVYCRDCDKCQKGVLNTYFLITRDSCFITISDNSKLSKKKIHMPQEVNSHSKG